MSQIQKVAADAFEAINKYPQQEEEIRDIYALMLGEIEEGEPEDNEIEHFYSSLSAIIETAIQDHIRGKITKEHK
jgi:hypothetical protein